MNIVGKLRQYRTMLYEELRWYFRGIKRHFFEIIVNPIIRKSNAFIPENNSKSFYRYLCAIALIITKRIKWG